MLQRLFKNSAILLKFRFYWSSYFSQFVHAIGFFVCKITKLKRKNYRFSFILSNFDFVKD